MAEQISSLTAVYRTGVLGRVDISPSITVRERLSRSIVQISGWNGSFDSVCEHLAALIQTAIPRTLLVASSSGENVLFRVGPERLWLISDENSDWTSKCYDDLRSEACVITDIAHSRTILRIAGRRAAELISRGLAVDIDDSVFPVGSFVQSIMQHIPVLVHYLENSEYPVFEIYVTKEYAISFWQWLVDTAGQFGVEILDAG